MSPWKTSIWIRWDRNRSGSSTILIYKSTFISEYHMVRSGLLSNFVDGIQQLQVGHAAPLACVRPERLQPARLDVVGLDYVSGLPSARFRNYGLRRLFAIVSSWASTFLWKSLLFSYCSRSVPEGESALEYIVNCIAMLAIVLSFSPDSSFFLRIVSSPAITAFFAFSSASCLCLSSTL